MLIGYGIVTSGQCQATLSQLYDVGCRRVFTDEFSTANSVKPGFEQALSHLSPNDILVIPKISHLGKSLDSILKNLDILQEKEANLHILGDNLLLPLKQSNLIQILVDFHHQNIKSKTQARKKSLQEKGNKPGRKPIGDKTKKKINSLLSDGGYTIEEICQTAKICPSSFHKYFPSSSRKSISQVSK